MKLLKVINEKLAKKTPRDKQTANFLHLYWDIAGFGVVFGSTLSFLPVFAARLGAKGWQIGVLSAIPALVGVLLTLSAGQWVQARPLDKVIRQTTIWHRVGFFFLIPIPLLLPAPVQIWVIIFLMLLMAIPGTALAIGFNALLAAVVPPAHRGHVVGRRNALFATTIMSSFFLSGWLLDYLSFEWGYVVVFGIGALGAVFSSYHLFCIEVPEDPYHFKVRPMEDHAQPAQVVGFSGSFPNRLSMGLRLWLKWRPGKGKVRGHIKQQVSANYWGVMVAYFCFHFAQILPTPLFPLFWVREAQLSDGEIGSINALFYAVMFMSSLFLAPLSKRLGNRQLTVWGTLLLAVYPLLTSFSTDITLLIVASVVGGGTWAILTGALNNRLLEHIPDAERPTYLAVYHLILNLATLSATLIGPLLADIVGLREALFIITVLRVGSGAVMARWG